MNFGSLLITCKNLSPKYRTILSLWLAALVFLLMPSSMLELRILAAWSAGVLCFVALAWFMMFDATPGKTRDRAQRREADHLAVFLLVVFIAFSSLFAIAVVLAKHKDSFTLPVGLSIVAIFSSWVLMQTMFTLNYAAFYYRSNDLSSEGEAMGGLEFSNVELPCYLDFLYFTFTLGMTSQTSDTQITSSAMRRLSLGHAIMSFFFYSVVITLTVSIISGLF
ncbi:DUF1345 domain-containing protein [Pelatocladus sp. BLCC-F211]|uniref:DUF1345 domain-containing protein n=1 Tax=Pelatocladus sp. BLCC-F211 TaxID=3342752 RepID=UPI0035BB9B81